MRTRPRRRRWRSLRPRAALTARDAGEQRRFSVFRPRGQGCRPGPTAPPRVQGPGPGWRPEAFAENATQGQRKEVGLIALARLQAKGTVPGAMWPPDPEGLMRNVPEEPTREKHSEVSAPSRVLFFKRTCLPAGNCQNGGDVFLKSNKAIKPPLFRVGEGEWGEPCTCADKSK